MKKLVDRKAILNGEYVEVFLKKEENFTNEKLEVFTITNFRARMVAIVEIDGKCYTPMPFNGDALTGILLETRDSFDDLVAQYSKPNAGGNASETKE